MKLTAKQEKFCHKYIETGNASEAYRQAYSTKRMKMETINNNAYNLLKRSDITARVKELQAELKAKSDYKKEDALKLLIDIATVDPFDYIDLSENKDIDVDDKGNVIATETSQSVVIKDPSELTSKQRRCIKSIKTTRYGTEVEFYDKLAGLDRLSKMVGWDEPVKNDINIMSKFTDDELEEKIEQLKSNL